MAVTNIPYRQFKQEWLDRCIEEGQAYLRHPVAMCTVDVGIGSHSGLTLPLYVQWNFDCPDVKITAKEGQIDFYGIAPGLIGFHIDVVPGYATIVFYRETLRPATYLCEGDTLCITGNFSPLVREVTAPNPAMATPDYVPPEVRARRPAAHVVVPTDLDDHLIPDDEPSWKRYLPTGD